MFQKTSLVRFNLYLVLNKDSITFCKNDFNYLFHNNKTKCHNQKKFVICLKQKMGEELLGSLRRLVPKPYEKK